MKYLISFLIIFSFSFNAKAQSPPLEIKLRPCCSFDIDKALNAYGFLKHIKIIFPNIKEGQQLSHNKTENILVISSQKVSSIKIPKKAAKHLKRDKQVKMVVISGELLKDFDPRSFHDIEMEPFKGPNDLPKGRLFYMIHIEKGLFSLLGTLY